MSKKYFSNEEWDWIALYWQNYQGSLWNNPASVFKESVSK